MFKVLECVALQHDRSTVGLAAAICLVGMLAFFLLRARAGECDQHRRAIWLLVAAATGGLSVWATHFVAMLAYQGAVPIDFDAPLTVLSALIAVVGFWLSLNVAEGGEPWRTGLSALTATLAVAAMHFTGTAAIRAAATIHYDVASIAVGAVVGYALFHLSFQLFHRTPGLRGVLPAAVAGILAICTLHFVSMSATELVPDPTLPDFALSNNGRIWLIGAIGLVTSLIILSTVAASFIDRYLTDLRGFANATLEGLAIVRDGRIIEANARFAEILRLRDRNPVGRDPNDLMTAADGRSLTEARANAVEALPRRKPKDDCFLEVGCHTIEYRGRPCQVLAVRDLTEKRIAERRIAHMAQHDALTDLPNRTLFNDRLTQAVSQAERRGDTLAVLALDLDRFKAVNDVFGHAQGDKVLIHVADIIKRCVGANDTPARIGGDEFVILQSGVSQPDGAHVLASRILETFRVEMNVTLDPTAVGVSIGVAVYPQDAGTPDELRNAADMALYNAKFSGRGVAAFYAPEMDADLRQRRQIESELRHAVLRRQLSLVFQPLFDAYTGACTGYEALMRWKHPDLGSISPAVFIPIAEETGMIVALGEWALREACREASQWDDGLSVAVNVSAVQFRVPNLPDVVRLALTDSGLAPDRLELEITETSLLSDQEATLAILAQLKETGVRVVMDDFGTGYSSLSNLQSFPFDKIKIDRSFVSQMETSPSARAIVKAIVGLGKSLDMPVVAEGIETFSQQRMVVEEGCEQLQGFLLGKPKSARDVERVSGLRDVLRARVVG